MSNPSNYYRSQDKSQSSSEVERDQVVLHKRPVTEQILQDLQEAANTRPD